MDNRIRLSNSARKYNINDMGLDQDNTKEFTIGVNLKHKKKETKIY